MKTLRQIYHPELFQGSLKHKNYFEGWYFKHVSADTLNAFAVIAGISLSDEPHSFIQFIDGNSGRTLYFSYPAEQMIFNERRFEVELGGSFFSGDKIILDLADNEHIVRGRINYTGSGRLPKSLFRPGIMGWYSFVPGMECNHGVVSTGHSITGHIDFDGKPFVYTGGKGYIEKDWGISFPECWVWLQCNNFSNEDASVMISVARIPWRGSWFMGLISFFRLAGRTEVFATYNGASVLSLKRIDESTTELIIEKGRKTLRAVIAKKGAGTLKAPLMGIMRNVIKESLNSEVLLELKSAGRHLFSGRGVRAGYEETENIFGYFR
ncbi:MAG: hypothetical protein GYA43_08365 [Bacteroidales bacterium]|nr:hypothetical protein [Bacteroidales bacterium]